MSKFNGFVERNDMVAGSKMDMSIAYVIRGVIVLLLAGLVYCAVGIRDDTRDLKRDMPGILKDIGELKEQGKTFATKQQLEAAEQRVKSEFTEQLKKGNIITSTQGK
jgi:hypothetical protein